MIKWMNLIFGSVAGGAARYVLAGAVQAAFGPSFPYGTLVVNMTGCLMIGVFDALANDKFLLGPDARILLMTGFCGAFTTFSTFILETSNLFRSSEYARAFANVTVSVALGFLLFRTGQILGRVL